MAAPNDDKIVIIMKLFEFSFGLIEKVISSASFAISNYLKNISRCGLTILATCHYIWPVFELNIAPRSILPSLWSVSLLIYWTISSTAVSTSSCILILRGYVQILNYLISVISLFYKVCSSKSTKNGLDFLSVFSCLRGVIKIGYIVLWFELLSILIYFTFTCKEREYFFSIVIISTFFRFKNSSYERFFTLDIIETPISVKLKANLLPTCINYNSESY